MIAPAKILFATLNGNVTGLKISPKVDNNVRPLLVYGVQALEPTTAKGEILFRNYSISMNLFADTYSACQTIAGQIIALLEAIERTQVAGYTVRRITASFSSDVYDEEIGFGTDLTVNITINEVTQ